MLRSTDDEELHTLVHNALETNQPILHHLNADTTWLLQIPHPAHTPANSSSRNHRAPAPHSPSPSRAFYNIILDPWLSGPQSDIASWFSRQWHAISPAYESVAEVSALCQRVEEIASALTRTHPAQGGSSSLIDAIAISHEFTDHCHKETLEQFDRSTPVIATTKAATLIRSWNHFHTVIETPSFGDGTTPSRSLHWASCGLDILPSWLTISRVTTGTDAFYYHSAILLAFHLPSHPTPQCIIYTPHGIHADSLAPVINAQPQLQTLAMLHGLHDVRIDWGQQLNLGAHNGLKAQRALRARYWLGTHDEVKTGGGIVSWFLRRKKISVAEALDAAVDEHGKGLFGGEYLELGNGRSLVLCMDGAEEVDEVNGVEDEL